ncbi:hypothetical protein SOPP22_10295 [Shewanella sp. OPT22]|nr:hypothetical protein SOPP22_10295 [Shewanella sp. OPT22]
MNLRKSSISYFTKTKFLLLASIVGLSGCGSSDDDNDKTGYIKFYNASKNSPAVFLTVDEDLNSNDSDDFENTYSAVEYGIATSDKSVPTGKQFYELAWQDDDSKDRDDLELIAEGQVKIKNEAVQLIVLTGDILQPETTLFDIPVIDEEDDDDNDLFNFRVLNVHPNAKSVELHYSKSNETFNEAKPIVQLALKELSDNQKFDQDDYTFYITEAGETDVLFTSEEMSFDYPSQYILVIRENSGAGNLPYILDRVSTSSTTEHQDFNASAKFKVFNGVTEHELIPSYQSSFDLYVGGVDDSADVAALKAGEFSKYLALSKGDYGIDITATNEQEPLLKNHLLTMPENAIRTVFFYLKEEAVDEDGDGDVDEDDDGEVDEYEVKINSIIIPNSQRESIYDHGITMVNLVDHDDFESVEIFFVRSDETIETAKYSSIVDYEESNSITLINNTYQVFAIATYSGSSTILHSTELTLNEESKELFMIIETDAESTSGYSLTVTQQ